MAFVETINLLWTSLMQTKTTEIIFGINAFSVIFNSRLRMLISGHVDHQNADLPDMQKLTNKIITILTTTNNNQIKEFIIKHITDVVQTCTSVDLSNCSDVLKKILCDHVSFLLVFLKKPQSSKKVECLALATLRTSGCNDLKLHTVITSRLKEIYRYPPPVFSEQNNPENLLEWLLQCVMADYFGRKTDFSDSLSLDVKKCDLVSMEEEKKFETNVDSEKIFKEERSYSYTSSEPEYELLNLHRNLLTSSSLGEGHKSPNDSGYSSLSDSETRSPSISINFTSDGAPDIKNLPYSTYSKKSSPSQYSKSSPSQYSKSSPSQYSKSSPSQYSKSSPSQYSKSSPSQYSKSSPSQYSKSSPSQYSKSSPSPYSKSSPSPYPKGSPLPIRPMNRFSRSTYRQKHGNFFAPYQRVDTHIWRKYNNFSQNDQNSRMGELSLRNV